MPNISLIQKNGEYKYPATITEAVVDLNKRKKLSALLDELSDKDFKGKVNQSTDISGLHDYKQGWHWIVNTAGRYVGLDCEVGDMIYCIQDFHALYQISDFEVLQSNTTYITNELIDELLHGYNPGGAIPYYKPGEGIPESDLTFELLNKINSINSLATVATTGNYNDLVNTPDLNLKANKDSDAIEGNVAIFDNNGNPIDSGINTSVISNITNEDISNWNSKEDVSNKVVFISESSTNVEYPTAKAVYDAIQRDDYDSQYLTLRFNANCPLKFTPRNGYKLFYKLDDNDWEQLTEEINVIGGSKVLLKGDTSEMTSTGRIGSFENYVGNNLVPTRCVDIYGNVMSLLYGDEFKSYLNSMENYTFGNLFYYCKWVRHLNNLILPAINLSANAYAAMFSDCKCVTAPKVLPATNIMSGAYSSMFSYTDITEAPDILATAIGERGCEYMFWNCKYLVKAPVLRILTMSESSYASMFLNCTSLKEAPNLIATNLDLNCYSSMFRGCTSLVTAPKLPATSIIHYGVYNYMFMGCTALEVAPELPSTNVGTSSTNSAYGGMFSGCTNLKFIKALFTNTPTQTNPNLTFTSYWLYNVAPTGTIVINDDVEWDIEANRGISGIPVGWKVYKLSEYGLEVREGDLINKADKDLDAVEGNIAIFNSEGNPVDSGKTFPIPYELDSLLTRITQLENRVTLLESQLT